MMSHKVLAIGLDGLDVTLAQRLMAEGQMPALADVKKRAARFLLDQGPAQRTGLAWEHVASGLSPDMGRRWSPVEFDPTSYNVWQEGAHLTPWWAETDLRVVVFDPPYVDLLRTRNTQGIVAWGAHDPGTVPAARPAALVAELDQRFGPYPAVKSTYATPWPSAARCLLMGEALCQALDVRTRAARWLAAERFPDWDFFFAVPTELHSGVEGLWHGVDAGHPLNTHPSAGAAARGLVDIHRALDSMVGQLVNAAGDAVIIAFNMGGMGPNYSDVQSMVLLPELLYRNAFGHSLLTVPPAWTAAPNCLPILDEPDDWGAVSKLWVPEPTREPEADAAGAMRAIARRLPAPVRGLLKGARSAAADWRSSRLVPMLRKELNWQPGNRYRHHWPRMPAFALPSFYDGRIRINLRGRERQGIVESSRYEETCKMLEMLLGECRDPRTGEPAVAAIERASTVNPLALTNSEADLLVVWRNLAAALEHPRLGLIGPVPLRRTGGHTGQGMAYLAAPGLEPGERGVRSAFDVVPTIVQLLGAKPATRLTGKSLLCSPV
jgi:hypothetical protein